MRLFGSFNDSVFRGPDMEGGADGDTSFEDTGVHGDSGGGNDGDVGDGGGADPQTEDRTLTVREQLKKSIAEVNAENQKTAPKPRPKAPQRQAGAAPAPAADPNAPPVSATPAPESLAKEAKADWEKTPPAIQQAFIKREQDMQRGVDELKQKYSLIDQAIAPHNDALRQMGASPAEAVNRMFLWFKALAANPVAAVPGLVKSFGMDWNQLVQATQQQVPGQQPQGQQQQQPQAHEEPPYVASLRQQIAQQQQYIQQVASQFGNIQHDINSSNEAKTRENLSLWSKDKDFFEDVRQDMARFIESGIIPLKNGQVDLDTAYERAIHFNPEVRAKVLAKQQQADTQVQQAATQQATSQRQQQANRARKAAVSIPASNAPGALNGGATPPRKPGQRTSVRDSLKAAMAELRDQ